MCSASRSNVPVVGSRADPQINLDQSPNYVRVTFKLPDKAATRIPKLHDFVSPSTHVLSVLQGSDT